MHQASSPSIVSRKILRNHSHTLEKTKTSHTNFRLSIRDILFGLITEINIGLVNSKKIMLFLFFIQD